MKQFLLLASILLLSLTTIAQQQNRWSLTPDGINWQPKPGETHSDHIEMSGKKVSTVVRYKVATDVSL
ncbi:MAG: hypothetical protein Q8L04_02920, partial [Ignavibacteria bacterium]|nr:hypothetical protein [Ignavibacteria bacterium]